MARKDQLSLRQVRNDPESSSSSGNGMRSSPVVSSGYHKAVADIAGKKLFNPPYGEFFSVLR